MERRRLSYDDGGALPHHSKRRRTGFDGLGPNEDDPINDRYTVAWVCALHIEMAAARAMLDEEHVHYPRQANDTNSYALGSIQGHNVVIACLPADQYGTNSAASVMSNTIRTFPNIKIGLMVGIGGGVPLKADIRLGDIVVGVRVMQYDLGKQYSGRLQRTGAHKIPDSSIRTVISNLRSRHELSGSRIPSILSEKMSKYPAYSRPHEPDRLFLSSYHHVDSISSCDECDQSKLETRKMRLSTDPVIYYGGIGSANTVMKDSTIRDEIARDLDVMCFEMEAAGLMDMMPCLPIRGICDYSDSHKAKGWQRYAAATAAAYAYEFLEVWKGDSQSFNRDRTQPQNEHCMASDRHKMILESLNFEKIDGRKLIIKAADSKTCRWFLKHPDYLSWADPRQLSQHYGILWIRGKPGAGKSTIMKYIYLESKKKDRKNQRLTASFFFNAQGEMLEKTVAGMYRSLLLQLFQGFPDLECVLDDPELLPQNHTGCPSLSVLKDLFRAAVAKLGQRSFTCFIDGLDECDEQQVMDLVEYFEGLAGQYAEEGVKLRICFSSRHTPYGDIRRGICVILEDQIGHENDLESYISTHLRIRDHSLLKDLQNRMLEKAAGVFLWVVLVVDILNQENRRGRMSIKWTLEQVPSGLSDLWKDLLKTNTANIEELKLSFITRAAKFEDLRHEQSQDAVAISEIVPLTDSGYASTACVVVNRQKLIEAHADDAATEYSVTSGTDFPEKKQYISKLVDHLATKTRIVKADKKTQSRVSAILPDLLKAFALRIGGQDATSIHRKAMALIYKHRGEITEAFNAVGYQGDEDIEEDSTNSDAVGWQDRMDLLWGNREPQSLGEPPDETRARSSARSSDTSGCLDEPSTRLLAYEETILNTVAFNWLLDRLQKELLLIPTEPWTMQKICETILSAFPPARRISTKAQPPTYHATFELEWDVFDFFRTQGYDGLPQNIFEGVIALTGCCPDAQATTCAQYLLQTWPSTSGELIEMIKNALTRGQGYLIENKLLDGTTLSVQIRDSKFLADVHGIEATIAEIGEQLAWLGAALRAPTEDTGLAYCTPHITIDSTPFQFGNQPSERIAFLIWFTTEKVTEAPTENGQCWQALFKNPFIVRGYPILRRAEGGTGLEAPLEIMAGLAQAHQIYHSDNKIYIKGFSTMLIPTRRCGDIICWHLLQEDGDGRISHLAARSNQYDHTGGLEALENSRHVLGWCLEAEHFTGSNQWSYSRLIHTMLPNPGPSGALFGRHVERGRAIAKQLTYFKGVKDTPSVLAYDGYVRRLQTLESQFVLFWDETDKRGWLLNGTSALLHAVESFLTEGSQDGSRGAFLFKGDDYKDLSEAHRTLSALEILNDEKYQRLPLYREGYSHTILKSQIEELCGVLEHFIDIQLFVMKDYATKAQPRKDLEGWDFKDLVTNHNTINSRVAAVNSCGKGWVDFVRDLKAVTLFGRCFGDLIRPSTQRQQTCSKWASLPTGRYYIAACVSDLTKVVESHGIYSDGHIRLSKTLFWHTPRPGSEFCQCRQSGQDASDQADCEPVQACFPLHLAQKVQPRKTRFALAHGKGALIFGQNSEFPWIWGNLNDPQECQLNELIFPTESVDVSSKSSKDSGIGSSVSRSDLESQTSARSMRNSSLTEPSTKRRTNSTSTATAPSLPRKAHIRNRYRVGIICALPKELMAVRALLDETHVGLKNNKDDYNKYALGRIGPHNVVATCLPEYGTNSAARVAGDMKRSFPLRFCLLVGIGGGVPSAQYDIRLGDVVVGESVIQYDLGKETDKEGFQRKYQPLQTPPLFLKSVLSSLRGDPDLLSNPLDPYLDTIRRKETMSNYRHPGIDRDILFESCTNCSSSPEPCRLPRMCQRRQTPVAKIHYGIIASGNKVIGNATLRDQKAAELKAICFEMEAAGVVNTMPCLVIRGISDYCDGKKNDEWQEYAAATAAAYAKLFLISVDEHEGDSHSDTDYSPPSRAKRRRLETE
ncbi:ankyrin 3 [Fusarium beomiforme]|uniref:Ankyrin 3 n=1 Tax=Fusarium beomiforme TaxID=44412 RepID=A0A9P5AAY7_9HYPO|nr:ankyrin 3 [Fusarium beomiforme]